MQLLAALTLPAMEALYRDVSEYVLFVEEGLGHDAKQSGRPTSLLRRETIGLATGDNSSDVSGARLDSLSVLENWRAAFVLL